tara:strand:+ start:25 stop:387 length:363 start_codon:yes stop_codon:yes gene_type:complete
MTCKVYFNNSCSICKFEIDHYKKITKNIDWVDISTNKNAKKETKMSAKNLLRRLHVKKKDKIYQGVDAFIELWSEIPRYRFLAFLVRKPLIYQLAWFLYEIFALFLFYKNKNQLNKLERL